jgi:hypothetical protein
MKSEHENLLSDLPAALAVFDEKNPAIYACQVMQWELSPELISSFVYLAERCERDVEELPKEERLTMDQIISDFGVHGGAGIHCSTIFHRFGSWHSMRCFGCRFIVWHSSSESASDLHQIWRS